MTAARLVLVSDTHLSPAVPQTGANWDCVLGYVLQTAPDLVIHLGDLTLDGAHDPADLHYGRRQLDRLPVPWHAVPGNHDIGDNPGPGAAAEAAVDAGRRQRWLDIVGPDHWSLTMSGWTLLAINAQLLGSGLAAEARQWTWLEEQLSERGTDQLTALISHKPVAATAAELAISPPYRFVPPQARHRLADLFSARPPALVMSGHAHQYRLLRIDGADHLWVPTTWAVLPEEMQPALGAKRCGIVSLELASGTPAQPQFVEPDGITQLTLITDIPDPYHRSDHGRGQGDLAPQRSVMACERRLQRRTSATGRPPGRGAGRRRVRCRRSGRSPGTAGRTGKRAAAGPARRRAPATRRCRHRQGPRRRAGSGRLARPAIPAAGPPRRGLAGRP